MFRSLSRITVAVALVLAFVLSTVPAQAQPRDPGAGFDLDASWLEVALGWIQGLLSGDGGGELTGTATQKTIDPLLPVTTGPCIDPSGVGCVDNP